MSGPRDDGRTTAKFLRGLTIGALIGAVLAGSSIWTRRLASRRAHDPDEAAAAEPRPSPPTSR